MYRRYKEINKFFAALLWIWQAPQNLAGLLLRYIYRDKIKAVIRSRGVRYYVAPLFPGGISLGNTIILQDYFVDDALTWEHEFGHSIQSRYLGPLYLFVIGIPSILWAWWWDPDKDISYYSFYTEKWADRLGGVSR